MNDEMMSLENKSRYLKGVSIALLCYFIYTVAMLFIIFALYIDVFNTSGSELGESVDVVKLIVIIMIIFAIFLMAAELALVIFYVKATSKLRRAFKENRELENDQLLNEYYVRGKAPGVLGITTTFFIFSCFSISQIFTSLSSVAQDISYYSESGDYQSGVLAAAGYLIVIANFVLMVFAFLYAKKINDFFMIKRMELIKNGEINAEYILSDNKDLDPSNNTTKDGKTMGTTSMVLAIIAIVLSFLPGISVIGIILAITAIVLGIIGLVKKRAFKFSLTGVIVGSIAFFIALITILVYSVIFSSLMPTYENDVKNVTPDSIDYGSVDGTE